jgi:hypothetical protein
MRPKLIASVVALSLAFATTAEAGPIRNLLGKLRGKPKAVAGKVLKAVGSCAGGICR